MTSCSIESCTRAVVARGWCKLHYARWHKHGDPMCVLPNSVPKPLEPRFWAKVDKNGPVAPARPDLGPCWLWTASKSARGYGMLGRRDAGTRLAHRIAYELTIGPVPKGLELDHLCRRLDCVRPTHLEPVTHWLNVQRGDSGFWLREKTHCVNGHEYNDVNTYWWGPGYRACRACCREKARRRRAAVRTAA